VLERLNVPEHKPTHTRAVGFALEIEQSMIERKFFEVMDAPHEEFRKVARRLADETRDHRARLHEEWERLAREAPNLD
jgi:hypothetical protein